MPTRERAEAIANGPLGNELRWNYSTYTPDEAGRGHPPYPWSSGVTWKPQYARFEIEASSMGEELRKSTPANDVLLAWGDRAENRPPQSWWDDTTDPFSPVDD